MEAEKEVLRRELASAIKDKDAKIDENRQLNKQIEDLQN